VVHTLDKVMQPAKASILDTLQSDSQFNSFLAALEAHGLAEELTKPGAITVFAPTDEAFARLDEGTRAKLAAGGSCGLSILQSHILKHAICSGAVQGQVQVSVTSVGGRQVRMERDGKDQVTVEGVQLLISDKVATNGVIHVVNDIIITQDSLSLMQCAQVTDEAPVCGGHVVTIDNLLLPPTNDLMAALSRDHSEFYRLIEFAGLDKELRENVFTVLAPTDDALAGLGSETRARLFGEKTVAEQVVRAHVLPGTICCASVPTMSRLRVRSHLGSQVTLRRSNRGGILADTAELDRCDSVAENGLIHSINNLVGGI